MSGFLFMGQVEDPEMDTALARGFPRIYGLPVSESSAIALREWAREREKVKPTGPSNERAGLWFWSGVGFERCTCGHCFYGPAHCPGVAP